MTSTALKRRCPGCNKFRALDAYIGRRDPNELLKTCLKCRQKSNRRTLSGAAIRSALKEYVLSEAAKGAA
jgi:hypothetical protein